VVSTPSKANPVARAPVKPSDDEATESDSDRGKAVQRLATRNGDRSGSASGSESDVDEKDTKDSDGENENEERGTPPKAKGRARKREVLPEDEEAEAPAGDQAATESEQMLLDGE